MTEPVILHGLPPSSYVRSARLMAVAKGVPHELSPADFRSPEYLALHPFAKMPALTHGSVHLFEVLAIGTYLDGAFDGPALQPDDPVARATMMQWISATNDYGYDRLVRHCVAERVIKPWRGQTPDEAKIAAALPGIRAFVTAVEAGLTADYLAGDAVSLADMTLAPIMVYFASTPEGTDMLPDAPRLTAWMERMRALPGYDEINALGGS